MILIAGPCVIESLDNLKKVAEELAIFHEDRRIDFYFKSSFDKANRTSLESYRGPGLQKGLEYLAKIKADFGFKLLTDVHECYQAKEIGEVVDIIQIPAFLCRQTDLIVAAAKTPAIVNIKKGQFMNPVDMQYSVLKALKTRNPDISSASYALSKEYHIWLTERGNSFGYGNLVVDMRSLTIMREYAPVVFDATHSVQMPGMAQGKSGGDSRFVPFLSRAAVAVGVDGFFMEAHTDPANALSDGANMITPALLKDTMEQLLAIESVLGEVNKTLKESDEKN